MNEESLFAAALERQEDADRRVFLDSACGGDAALRHRLDRLLAAHGKSVGILEYGPEAAVSKTETGPQLAVESLFASRFKLRQKLGAGGMGEVWVADQIEPVQRRVALKVIRPGLDSASMLARFDHERQALALMDHPNIAKVLDAGVADARPYFVMELIEGVPITEYCDVARLSPRERLRLFIPVCHALQHAHQKGIIHRDLKPSNIVIGLYDGHPVPKVIDFGVAKSIGPRLTEQSVYTEVGALIGTLEYMSPEQTELNNFDIDTRSDIYSLGVLIYELLTGTTPFKKERFQRAGYDEIRRIVKEEDPPKPSTRLLESKETLASISALRQIEPTKLTKLVRGELDWIVMKALEKDRQRRYETANGLAMDLQNFLDNGPVLACPPSARYRLLKFLRRNKGRLMVAACLFLAVAVMAASIGWAVRDRAAREAEIEQAESIRRAKVEEKVRGFLNEARTLIAENKLASARETLAQAKVQLENDRAELGNLANEVESGAAELDRFQLFLGLIDRAHQAETAPVLDRVSVADRSHRSTGTSAPVRAAEGQPGAAVPWLLKALQSYGVMEQDDWTNTLEGGILERPQVEKVRRIVYEELLRLADDISRRQQEHPAGGPLSVEQAARQALIYLSKAESTHQPTATFYALRARSRKTLGEEAASQADQQLADQASPTIALDHFLRGQAAYEAKKLDEAVQAFEAALRLEPQHYWSLMSLGFCMCDLGSKPEYYAEAARIFTGCILNRPDHAHAYHCRANAYAKLGRYDQALPDFMKAIQLDSTDVRTWRDRGTAFQELGQHDQAVADYTKAVELEPTSAPTWNNRGVSYDLLGQPSKAIKDFDKAIELNPRYALAWRNRGVCNRKLNQPKVAVNDFSKAIESDPKLIDAWFDRGDTYFTLTQMERAIADYSRVIELDPTHVFAWCNRGLLHSRQGQLDKAVADFSKTLELDPKLVAAWYNRGNAYNQLGQPNRAVADFSRVIELDQKHAQAWNNRGVAHDSLDQPDKAVTDYTKAIELNPKNKRAWNNRGAAYNKLGQPGKAITDFTMAIELDPKYPLAWCNRGIAYNNLAKPDKAVADFSQAIELDPTEVEAWHYRGLAYIKLGQPEKAVADCSKAVKLSPEALKCWKLLGLAHYRAGNWESTLTAFDKSVELSQGGDAGDRFFLAMAQQKLGHQDEARRSYEQAIRWLNKNHKSLENDKMLSEELLGYRTEAEKVLALMK